MSNNLERAKSAVLIYLKYNINIVLPCCNMSFYEEINYLAKDKKIIEILKPISIEDCIIKRLKNANNNISTPYFVIASDDDLLMLNGLRTGVEFLNNNNDYSNYFGLTARMLLKISPIPLINFEYQNKPNNCELNEFLNTFKTYRSYPLIYGINNLEVLKIFVNLFTEKKTNWEGLWELNFALAVSISGKAYYNDKNPYLLRLMHKSSRTSLQDFPELPSYDDNLIKYLSKYINLDYLIETLKKKQSELSEKDIIVAVFVDIISDCIYLNSYVKIPEFKINLFKYSLNNIFKNIKLFIKKPKYFISWLNFNRAAIFYINNRLH